ncbi:MAG TPA: hypothetical protein VK897_26815 [Anaerolineales bacterium]|nr:hypothetical protein [Anaerolineales bacterium]
MNTPNENQDTVQTAAYNPFPEPQTIPSGWDLSELSSTSQSELKTDKDNPTDVSMRLLRHTPALAGGARGERSSQ